VRLPRFIADGSSPVYHGRQIKKEARVFNRKSLTSVAIPLIGGSLGLMHQMQQPRFATFRNVDVVQLLGSGMCFGVALVALFALLRGPRNA
jgi:hypothetical protein